MAESVPIPEPAGLPFLGNLGEFKTGPLADLTRLSKTYGMVALLCLAELGSNMTGRSLQRKTPESPFHLHVYL